jgi:hypothetical protein
MSVKIPSRMRVGDGEQPQWLTNANPALQSAPAKNGARLAARK